MVKSLSLLCLCLLIVACHPTHTSKQIDTAAQNIEVRDKVSIKRWNHHVFSSGAKVALSLEDNAFTQRLAQEGSLNKQEFLKKSQSVFNQYFSQVVVINSNSGSSNSRPHLPAGFHFRMKLDEPIDGEEIVRLSLTISDINSRDVIDKIAVSVDPASLAFGEKDHWEVMEKPLHQVTELLTGK